MNKLNDKANAIIIAIFTLIAVVLIGQYREAQYENKKDMRDYIYQVCNESRISPTITEEKCAKLQDNQNMEFNCAEANRDPSNYCWVEFK